jgi:hypothetical protein
LKGKIDMSYNSKKTISSMAVGALVFIAYIVYALGETAPVITDLRAWAVAILIFIGIGVAVTIIIQILFHIAYAIGIAIKDGDDKRVDRIMKVSMVEDERDKLIMLKSSQIGYICASFGFAAGLLVLVLGLPVLFILHIMFGSFAVGSIVEGGVSIYHYESGVRNG